MPAEDCASRKARLSELMAQKREAMRRKQEAQRVEEVSTRERWSGLRIADRCIRAEKWDASMKSKALVPFWNLSALTPHGKDQVVIGVLCVPPALPTVSPAGEKLAEWTITDIDKNDAKQVTLLLAGAAADYWADRTGGGRSCVTVGSMFGVLNPSVCRNGRAMRVAASTQIIKLGSCPSLAFCSAKGADGLACRLPYNEESGLGYCSRHAKMSHGECQAQRPMHGSSRKRPLEPPTVFQRRCLSSRPPERPASAPLLRSGSLGTLAAGKLSDGSAARDAAACPVTAGGTMTNGLEAATRLLTAQDPDPTELLEAIHCLEAAGLDGEALRRSGLYSKLGLLVHRPDKVGLAATRLRRTWRALLDGAGVGP